MILLNKTLDLSKLWHKTPFKSMAGKGDEDFWNSGGKTCFNFDDDEEAACSDDFQKSDRQSSVGDIFSSTVDEVDTLPIHSLISKRNLDLILEDVRIPSMSSHVPPVEESIKKAFLGKPCVFSNYKTLDDKCDLLDQAINTYDGNVILMVILFLVKTLKSNIFLRILSKRKIALKHYENYLVQNNKLQQLGDLYMATGNTLYIVDLFYLSCKRCTSNSQIKSKLDQFVIEHSTNLQSDRERQNLNNYILFLKWQLKSDINCESVTEALAMLSRNNFEKNKDDSRILEFRSDMKIGDFQFEWIYLNILSTLSMWKKLTDVFIKPNWLTKKSSLKSVIDLELILTTLHKHDAPRKVLEDFLTCMVDTERSIALAKRWQCHRFIIDSYINQRDRTALINYTNSLNTQSEDYFYAKNALKNTDKKWKN